MKYLFKTLNIFYTRVIGSIAFYPILISIGFTVLAVLILSAENLDVCITIKEKISYLLIKDIDTARTMLSTLIGGIFSLTVFSFSMVMVVLSQASSNFSPRLLPGLISNKKHQVILGAYIGTLLYSLIVLMNVKSFDAVENSVGLSILLGVFFGVSCTGLFVYFIHTISQEIQIQNIVNRIYGRTIAIINRKIEAQKETNSKVLKDRVFSNTFLIKSKKTGYYKSFSNDLLFNSFQDSHDINLEIVPHTNCYIHKGDTLFKSNKELSEEESNALLFSLVIESNMHTGKDYIANMIKLMEVAIRAMSPGINDPRTAVDVINKLGLLMQKAFKLNTCSYLDKDGITLKYHDINYNEIMRLVFQPLRQYSKADSVVMHKLLQTLNNLYLNNDIDTNSKNAITLELIALKEDAKKSIFNENDLKTVININ